MSLFAVFDGHGGSEVSLLLKESFCRELISLQEFKDKRYKQALKLCFRRMDEMLRRSEGRARLRELTKEVWIKNENPAFSLMTMNGSENIGNFMGSTAVVVLITNENIFCANSGDSRAVLGQLGGSSKLGMTTVTGIPKMCLPLSQDHKPTDFGERARIEAAGGFI